MSLAFGYNKTYQKNGGHNMRILISSDSVADLPKELLQANNIPIIPLPITLGENTYLDGLEVTPDVIFEFVEKHKILPKTSAINEFTYKTFFNKNLKEYDAIVHLTISSKLSLCYENAVAAAKDLEQVFVVDTKTLSSGIGALLLKACALRDKGKTPEQIVQTLNTLKQNVHASFIIEKLEFLHKGGRCSSVQLLGANLLKIHPSILNTNGKLDMYKKYKGKMIEVVKTYVMDTLAENPNPDNDYVFITNTASPEMVQLATELLQKHSNFKHICNTPASSTITSHCGKNTLGLLFLNK